MAKKNEAKNGNAKNSAKVTVYKVNDVENKKDSKIRREKTIQTVLVVLIIVLAIAAIFSAIQTFFPNLFGKFSLSGELAAKVNGKPITLMQLNNEYDRLPLQYKYVMTKEIFLKQLIDEILLTEEAQRQGLSVSDAEVNENLNAFMLQNNITEDKLNEILKTKNLDYVQLRNMMQNQLLIDKLLQTSVKSKVNITSEMALQYYNDNPETFKIPASVTARHILIGFVNRTAEEAAKKANEVLAQLKNDKSNFCDLVKSYSDDAGSIDKCGEYTFPKGQMVAEFENRAFEQSNNAVSIVNTAFGSHILWTINKTSEQLIDFRGVQDQINLVLAGQQEKMIYSEMITGLRAKAEIINYLEQKEQELENKTALENKAAPVVTEPAKAETTEPTPATAEMPVTAEIPAEDEEVANEQNELKEEIEPAVTKVVVVEKPEVKPAMGLADCLTAQGAALYGAYWDSSTKTQKGYFGVDVTKVNYIECGVQEDYRAQAEICKEAGILAYPTWFIKGQKLMGIQTPGQLASLTGCTV